MLNNLYWSVYKNLEKELIELSNHIHIDDKQLNVYSMKIAELLLRTVVEVESLAKELYLCNGGSKGDDKDLYFDTDCLEFLRQKWNLSKKKVQIVSNNFHFEEKFNITFNPLKNAHKGGDKSESWLKAYQAIKHNRRVSLEKATLKNLIRAMAGLYILNLYYKDFSYELNNDSNGNYFDSSCGSDVFSIFFLPSKKINVSSLVDEKEDLDEYVYLIISTQETAKPLQELLRALDVNVRENLTSEKIITKLQGSNSTTFDKDALTEALYSLQIELYQNELNKNKVILSQLYEKVNYQCLLNKNQFNKRNKMTTQNFLVEIGTEELPPKALKTLATSFADNVEAELNQAGLTFDKIEWFAAPRRLAVKVLNLATQQPSKEIEKRGPAVSAAFDAEGKPTKAAEGWARGCGITVDQAERIATDKGEWLVHRAKIEGQPTKNLLNDIVANALAKLPIPKPMRWADKTVQFIRPVHTVTMLLGDELIEGEILGVESARTIRGHRFLGEKEFEIQHADQYPQLLREKGSVVADFNERKAEILAKSQAKATALGGVADIEESLLEEVTSLVEYPNVLAAKFEERFLAVPAEALVYTMKGDQKYFPIYDKDGKLLPHFIFVSNINPEDPTAIIEGNEKVVRPRLTDAEFFFKTDLKQKLVDRLPRLETVLFQQQLGTLKDKTDRIEQLAGEIAKQIGADEAKAKRAGLLSKCDLMTNMVFEFTDTQGVMGMHYARHDGEDEEVAVALNEQYMPRFAGDELPKSLVASAVALADKFDTLTGIFGIGQAPKGSADPFALRRAALGALRIIVEKNLPLDLEDLVKKSAALFGDKLTNQNVVADVVDFMLGRFRAWYQDEGIAVDVIQAVLARRPTRPADFDARVRAVSHFRTLDSAEALAAANKRVSNILAKADAAIGEINLTACVEPAEKALAEAVLALRTEVQPLIAKGDYTAVLDKLANLRVPVDSFFDNVMVNAEDPALRQNRLAILNTLQGLFLQVADISVLQ